MGGDKVTYLEKELKAARDKKAEAGCDAACKRTTDDLIASLDVSLAEASATTAPDTTTTTTAPVTTTIAEDSAALLFGPAWAAAVAAGVLVANTYKCEDTLRKQFKVFWPLRAVIKFAGK